MAKEIWYRLEDVFFAPPIDEFGEAYGRGRRAIAIHEFKVIKHTPKGVRLCLGNGETRVVIHHWRKKFACATIAEAKESYIARKQRQQAIYGSKLRDAKILERVAKDLPEDHRVSRDGTIFYGAPGKYYRYELLALVD